MLKVVIVGGGPVGMMTAIMLSKLGHIGSITVLEKRAEFKRHQIVLLDPKSWRLIPEPVKSKLFGMQGKGCFILPPSKDNLARCYRKKLPLASIELRLLEQSLLEHMQKIAKVKLMRPVDVTVSKKDYRVYANRIEVPYDILIGAAGKNSVVRQEILKARLRKTSPRRQVFIALAATDPSKLRGIYTALSPGREKRIGRKRKAFHKSRFFRSQYGGYYVAIALTPSEFKQMSTLPHGSIPQNIIERLNAVCAMVNAQCNLPADIIETSLVDVETTKSAVYSRMRPKPVFLVGDAAMTTHFFTGTGLNNGIQSADVLVRLLRKHRTGRVPTRTYRTRLNSLEKKMNMKIMEVVQAT